MIKREFNLGAITGAIAKNGKSEYSVLVEKDAPPSVAYAAKELTSLIERATGAVLPVTTEKVGKVISLGNTDLAKSLGISVKLADVTHHGFNLTIKGDDIIIVAAGKTALIYAVYRFLELNMGYKYYTPDEVIYDDTLVMRDSMNVIDYPDFHNRDVFNLDTNSDPDNTVRLYLSGCSLRNAGDAYGEGYWWSTLHDQSLALQIVDYTVYRKKYPHWYFGKEGGSNGTNPHICYTEALYSRDEYEKGDWNEPNYNDGRHGLFWTFVYNLINNYIAVETDKTLFQLGMSDNYDFCDCERCTRDVEKYTRAGIAVRFANAVADEVKKWQQENCPEREIYLTMFAYLTISQPPTKIVDGKWLPIDDSVIVRDNIIMRYAPIQENYMFSFLDKENNPGSYNEINGWKAVTKRFAIWDYRIDFGSIGAPFPQWITVQEIIRLYRDMGAVDIFHQGCRTSGGTPFCSMDNWVRSRMLWNADQEYFTLADEFIDVYYGEAGDVIREYIKLLTDHYWWCNREFGYKGHSHHCMMRFKKYFPLDFVQRVEALFAKGYAALDAVKDANPDRYEKLKARLDGESMFYRFCKLCYHFRSYGEEELEREAITFRKCGQGKRTHVWYNTFDSFWALADTFKYQFVRKGEVKENE